MNFIMMKNKLLAFKAELLSYTQKEKFFILFAMICGFCITAEYSITKPISNSIFITHYSASLYPYAWLLTVPINLLIVALYNRFLPRLGCFKMFLITVGLTMGMNCISGLYISKISFLPFLLYILKDIYVLLMFQQLWSVIHSVTKIARAKYLYGVLFGVGGSGAILGSMIPGFFAVKVGSEHLLFMTIPIYLLFILFYYLLLQYSGFLGSNEETLSIKKSSQKISQGMKLILSSTTLKFILLIVILMQFSSTILDFQFNSYLAKTLPDQDLRTEFYGKIWGIVNISKIFLQFFATFLLVEFLGLRKSHFVVPGVLLFNSIGCLFYPSFPMITYSFGVIKAFDYSLFNIIKEMLYVPLTTEEKFKAKAIIDVFAYRTAKAFASVVIIGLQVFIPTKLPYAFSYGPLCLFLVWMSLAYFMFKQEKIAFGV